MSLRTAKKHNSMIARVARGALGAGLILGLGGCAGSGVDLATSLNSDNQPKAVDTAAATPQTELEKATEYWGGKFAKSPNTLEFALNYARNLKAMGRKQQALSALQHASTYHAQNRELASEYGRLALELDQVQTAKKILEFADDPTKPDWRVISARGTVLAKEGNHKDAIPMFERALALSNNNTSVMNNLAMAYALGGRADDSERLLREASLKGGPSKVHKNLALVLGLQGKYDEAQLVGGRVLSEDAVKSDTQLVRQMVRLDPKPYQPVLAATAPAAAKSTAGDPAAPTTAAWTTVAKSNLKPADTKPAKAAAAAAPLRNTTAATDTAKKQDDVEGSLSASRSAMVEVLGQKAP